MSDPIPRQDVVAVMDRLGHRLMRETKDWLVYEDTDTSHEIMIALDSGSIAWDALVANLEYHGINARVFAAEYEAM